MIFWIILIIIFVLIVLLGWMVAPQLKKPDWSLLLGRDYAHRGLHTADQSVPENSMAAFLRAVEHRFGIELDVYKRQALHHVQNGLVGNECAPHQICQYRRRNHEAEPARRCCNL